MSATRFAWACIGGGSWEPPQPRRGARYGADPVCWLCGGETQGVGWPRETAIPTTFAGHNTASAPHSATVCQPCAAFASGESWQRHVASRSPAGVGKVWQQASWRSFSHLFASPDHHECPGPARWREILLDPPQPPFLAIVSLSARKNLIYRARVAAGRERFPVQIEESAAWVERVRLADCLAAFEALTDLGFRRDDVLSGDYHPAQTLKVGLSVWRAGEDRIRPWRAGEPDLMQLCHLIARRPPERSGDSPEPPPAVAPALDPAGQGSLAL